MDDEEILQNFYALNVRLDDLREEIKDIEDTIGEFRAQLHDTISQIKKCNKSN